MLYKSFNACDVLRRERPRLTWKVRHRDITWALCLLNFREEAFICFSVVLSEVFLIHFFEVVEIIRAFGIDALMDDKVFAFLLGNQGMATVWAAQLHRGETAFVRWESCIADFAEKLSFGTIVFIEERFRGITAWAGTVVLDNRILTGV